MEDILKNLDKKPIGKDLMDWVENNKKLVVVGFVATAALTLNGYAYFNPKVIVEKVEVIKEVQKNNILFIDSVDKKILNINLKDMYTIKSFSKTINKIEKFRVARGIDLGNGKSIYITIDEPIKDKMIFNKDEFLEFKK